MKILKMKKVIQNLVYNSKKYGIVPCERRFEIDSNFYSDWLSYQMDVSGNNFTSQDIKNQIFLAIFNANA